MNLAKASGTLGMALLAALVSLPATAGEAGWYGGISVGPTRAKIDDARITSGLLGAGYATTSIQDDNNGHGYKLFGGYQVNKNFAVEGGFFDLGRFGYTANTVPVGTLNGNIKLKGFNLDAVGMLPVSEKFSLFARLGLNYADASDSFSGTGAVRVTNPNPSKRDTNLKMGVGLQYAFNESWAMRVEAERYRINDAIGNKGDIDMFSVGLIYRFGAKAQQRAPRAAEAAPVVVAAQPAPVPAPMAASPVPPPARTRVTFSADSLFEFDKAAMTAQGRQALDKFVADLKGSTYRTITVTGHTDRLGPHDYNMTLSSHRADAVKAYLMEAGGIDAGRISATGVDGADPLTRPEDCKGSVATAALIACLQPDRRVDVDVEAMQ